MSYRVMVLDASKGKADKKRMSYLDRFLVGLNGFKLDVPEVMSLFSALSAGLSDFQKDFPGEELEIKIKSGKSLEDSCIFILPKGKRIVESNILFEIRFTKMSQKWAREEFLEVLRRGKKMAMDEREVDELLDYADEKGGKA